MYFTGSAHFNRSMRNLAARLNMSLNEHALYTGVIRQVCTSGIFLTDVLLMLYLSAFILQELFGFNFIQ